MRKQPLARRRGFTLLEVLLAATISVGLFYGLYTAMQVELQQASVGRDAVERATLARSVINRFSIDLTESLTPPKAKPKGKKSSSSSTSSSSTPAASAEGDSSEQVADQVTTAIPLQAGVIGYGDRLTIFTTRVPDPRTFGAMGQEMVGSQVSSDIRRITYWLGENGGLCRQEIPWVTGEQVYGNSEPVTEDDKMDDDYIIAREVVELSFEYYDIDATNDDSGWTDYWDGSQPGPDGRTPLGPPTAIRVRFVIRSTDASGEEKTKEYRHVIPIVTASGPSMTESMMPEMTDGTMATMP